MNDRPTPTPIDRLRAEKAYSPGRTACPVDLRLDGNEGRIPPPGLFEALAARGPEVVRRYPDRADLEAALAERVGLEPAAVLVLSLIHI